MNLSRKYKALHSEAPKPKDRNFLEYDLFL